MQPLASLKALNDPIYEVFYGFTEQPFAITTDPKFLFLSASHRHAFEELMAGLRRHESLLLLTGETGTGKTTLCRAVIDALGTRTFASIQHYPYMQGAEMLRLVIRDFGLVSHEDLRRGVLGSADVPQLLDVLEGFLRTLVPIESRAIVVLDEAQSLSPKLLDEIRMLTAFESHGRQLVQIVLCGQPALLKTLDIEPLYALSERVTRRVALGPLTPEEVGAYIQHRLVIAGGTSAVSFAPEAAALIAELSRGLPRRVNLLCDRALQEGRIEGANVIPAGLVKRAARSLAGALESRPHAVRPAAPRPEASPETAPVAPFASLVVESEARPGGRRRWIGRASLAAGVAALAGTLAYSAFASSVLAESPVIPRPPGMPANYLPAPPEPPALPTDEEIKLLMSIQAEGTG